MQIVLRRTFFEPVCEFQRNDRVSQRIDFTNQHNACVNCLSFDHTVQNCASKNRCFVCRGMHSVFMHVDGSVVNSTAHQRALVDFMPIVKAQVNDRE